MLILFKDRKTPSGFNRNNLKDVGAQAQSIANILKQWRTTLPPHLAWSDNEPPSTDINVARLRAKYYGGLYMVLRTFLRTTMNSCFNSSSSTSYHVSSPANALASSTYPNDLNAGNIKLVHECIESAIRSTIAFDRVGAEQNSLYQHYISRREGRLILTNIFGTLHA
jgi:hypothetical protein